MSWLVLIVGLSRDIAACLLLPNSMAALMVIALASPIPLIFISSLTDNLPNSGRLCLLACNISCARSSAVLFFVPWLIKMASNSESLRDMGFLLSSFSLGLSSFAHPLIEYFSDCMSQD